MSLSEILNAMAVLSLDDCRQLSRKLRQRVGVLAQQPRVDVLMQCSPGKTASFKIDGQFVSGQIVEVSGNALTVRFSGGETLCIMMAELEPDGFGKPITAFPPHRVDYCSPQDTSPKSSDATYVALWKGQPYLVDSCGLTVSSCRQLIPAVIAEPIPATELVMLTPVQPATLDL